MKSDIEERLPQVIAIGSYAYGWQQLKKHFLYLIIISIIVAIAEAPFSNLRDMEWENNPATYILQVLGMAYGILLLPVIKFGGDLLFLRSMRNEELKIEELFVGFKSNYVSIILANLITLSIIIIGFLFFIVPGIILVCRLIFVSYLVMDKNMEPIAALEKSWAMTKGHGWRIFGMFLLAIPVFITGLICFIVGVFVSIAWIKAAFAALYHAIDLKEQEKLID